jgi:uroporphyrinogen decarboxylase
MNTDKTAISLTSRERVTRALERREHDRIPRHDSFWRETLQRWEQEGLVGGAPAVLRQLGSDVQGLSGSSPAPFPGRRRVLREDHETEVFEDSWGATVRYWKNKSGTPEHIAWGCDSRENWEAIYKPAYQNYKFDYDPDQIRELYRQGRAESKWCFLNGLESFESTRRLMGDEGAMLAMASEPEWFVDVSRTYTDAVLQGLDTLMSFGIEPDGLWMYGDMAYKTGTMCSPDMYRELVWPDHKRLADWAHAHGMKFIFHTDGDVNGVVDLYLEAGFDCLQPLEAKANMDVRQLAPRYGDRLSFWGNLDIMTMITNDLPRIEAELSAKLAAAKPYHGYIYHSDHSVPPQVSWQTYQGIIRLLDQYGNY